MTERDQSRDRPGDEMVRITVAEAARRLGISEAGVRKRIQRGQIPHERGEDRRVWVWVSPGEVRHAESRDQPVESRDRDLVPELRDRIRFLERQLEAREDELRRRDVMLLNMTEAMKAMAPPEPGLAQEEPYAGTREYAVTPTPQPGRVEPQVPLEGAQEPAGSPGLRQETEEPDRA
jgi:hypothetical protein